MTGDPAPERLQQSRLEFLLKLRPAWPWLVLVLVTCFGWGELRHVHLSLVRDLLHDDGKRQLIFFKTSPLQTILLKYLHLAGGLFWKISMSWK